jgi:hypothetical protein
MTPDSFFWFCKFARENFVTLAMGNTYSKIPLIHPWGVLYNLTKLGLKGDLKPKSLHPLFYDLNTN